MGFALLWKTKGYITNINEFLIQKSLQPPQDFNRYGPLCSLSANVVPTPGGGEETETILKNCIFRVTSEKNVTICNKGVERK